MDLGALAGVVTVTGFAIQQTLQIIDPVVSLFVGWATPRLPKWASAADVKKSAMGVLSFALGVIVACGTGVRLLKLVRPEWSGDADLLITAIVMSAGTEGANTIVKYGTYVKESRKREPLPPVQIVPGSGAIARNAQLQLLAVANGAEANVTWKVLDSAGGNISATGLYTAPGATGTYHVVASSTDAPGNLATASVTVQ